MLKKIVDTVVKLLEPYSGDILADALHYQHDLIDDVVTLSIDKIGLERQLHAARTRASKNGCLALLAFGLIAVEIFGIMIYFLPK